MIVDLRKRGFIEATLLDDDLDCGPLCSASLPDVLCYSYRSCYVTSMLLSLLLSLDSFFDAIGYLFDAFVNISPADWEFATVYWESEVTNDGEGKSELVISKLNNQMPNDGDKRNTYLIGMYCLISLALPFGTK